MANALPLSLASGASGIPSITGGAAAPSGVYATTQTKFGSVFISNGSNAVFWLFMLGAGYLIWRKVK